MMTWMGKGNCGSLVADDAATLSIRDHGLTVGDGVFETLKVTAAGPFAVSRHLERLTRSGEAIGLRIPDLGGLRGAIDEVWHANRAEIGPQARLRVTITAGESPLGSERGVSQVSVMVTMALQKPWPERATVCTVPWTRNERGALAGVKSTSYAENVVALTYAREHGADEGIFLNSVGELCEGSSTNIFVVHGGTVTTPPLSSGCLAGVTRELVLEWCGANEHPLSRETAQGADEVFLTSSTRDIQPVCGWDGVTWQTPGPVTASMMATFGARAAAHIDP